MTRSAYHKHWQRERLYVKRHERIVELTNEIRMEEPMTGCRKIHNRISATLAEEGILIGRDKLFEVLGERGMLVKTRRAFARTTYSNHSYAVAPNRVKTLNISRPNQVFVADITYIRLRSGFAYLFLVTDLFSRKIVGYHLSSTLRHEGAIAALEMALEDVSETDGIIHHSDRGCQYCCHEFLKTLGSYKMIPSMTDENHCYQNAVAERVNGTLKMEFFLDSTFKNKKLASDAIDDAIRVYNTKRTHWSLHLQTPQQVHQEAA